jgi:uncharacterized protein (DUF58 family)
MTVPSRRLIWLAALVALPALTLAGLAPAWAVLADSVVALCAMIATLDAVLGLRRVARVQLSTPPLTRLTKDVETALPFTLANRSAGALRIRVAAVMPDGIASPRTVEQITAQPGQLQISWPCTGISRGDHELRDVQVEAISPLGFWQARASRPVQCSLRVYPNLRDRATAALFLRRPDAGLRLRRQVGKGREFDNLRHYLPGDSFEDIHWKATARRGFPTVKLYQVEHAQEVYAVIDSSRLSAREDILDYYVNSALHLALLAERQGDRFGVVTFSDRTHRFLRAHRGLAHFRLCRETIYNLRSSRVSPDFRDVFTNLHMNLRRRALLVFFTQLDDALLAETFAQEISLLARRHVILVTVGRTSHLKPLFTGEPPSALGQVYRGLAGQMLWNRMRELNLALHSKGVRLTLAEPARMKTQVLFDYLDVKRRQLL